MSKGPEKAILGKNSSPGFNLQPTSISINTANKKAPHAQAKQPVADLDHYKAETNMQAIVHDISNTSLNTSALELLQSNKPGGNNYKGAVPAKQNSKTVKTTLLQMQNIKKDSSTKSVDKTLNLSSSISNAAFVCAPK